MPDSTATQPGQTAAPNQPGTANPDSGTSGQQASPSPAQTSPGAAPAQTSAPDQDVLVAKVYGSEVPVDIRDRKRLQELVQKGLAFDQHREKEDERITARAEQLIQERAQKQAEDQRLSQLREADPLAYEFESYRKTGTEKTQAIEHEVTQLRETIHNLTWTQQLAESKRQNPDLNQRDWNRVFAEVVASKGQTTLNDAATMVKTEKEAYAQEVIDGYLHKLKANASSAGPAVPSGTGGTPSPNTGAPVGLDFSDKEKMRQAVQQYVASHQGVG